LVGLQAAPTINNVDKPDSALPILFLSTDSSHPIYCLADTGSAVLLINDMALTQQAQVVPFTVPVKALTDTTIPINGVC
jgi:hypothetical protein